MNIPSWDRLFLEQVYLIASKSKDTSTQMGAGIVKDKMMLSLGYNGIPRGVSDSVYDRYEKPEKYYWFEHAERNAFYNCSRNGVNTSNSILYTQALPCADCARATIQVGVAEVVVHKQFNDYFQNEKWTQSQKRSEQMFFEAGITLRYFDGVINIKALILGNVVLV